MAKIVDLVVPNIGNFKNVEIIEVLIKENENIKKNDGLITLESEKSSVEVPSQFSGKIKIIKVKVGDKISEGDKIGEIEIASDEPIQEQKSENKKIEIENENGVPKNTTLLKIPTLGTAKKLIISEIINFLAIPRDGIFNNVVSLGAILSFCISIFLFSNFFSWIGSSEVISISPILSPSEILSPTFTLIILTLHEN